MQYKVNNKREILLSPLQTVWRESRPVNINLDRIYHGVFHNLEAAQEVTTFLPCIGYTSQTKLSRNNA